MKKKHGKRHTRSAGDNRSGPGRQAEPENSKEHHDTHEDHEGQGSGHESPINLRQTK